ncbi:MAG: hypothetical protein JWQ35_1992, partial [Bacteriovoracaceae bacterium]|nr:hypothetical protein [Bacteriovoracaceae bacterium]
MKQFIFYQIIIGSLSSLFFLAGNSASFAGDKTETTPSKERSTSTKQYLPIPGEFKYFEKDNLKIDPTSDFRDEINFLPADFIFADTEKKKIIAPTIVSAKGKEFIYLRNDVANTKPSMQDRLIEIESQTLDPTLLQIYRMEVSKFLQRLEEIKLEEKQFNSSFKSDPATKNLSYKAFEEKKTAHEKETIAKLKAASDKIAYSIDKNGDLVWHGNCLIPSYQQIVDKKDADFIATAVTKEDSKHVELSYDFVDHIKKSKSSEALKNIILTDQTPPKTNIWDFENHKIVGENSKENLSYRELAQDLFARMRNNYLEDIKKLQIIEEGTPGTWITNSWDFT